MMSTSAAAGRPPLARSPLSWMWGPAGVITFILHAREVTRQRRQLMALDDHALKDIGLSRADACCEASRPWWDF